MRTRMPKRLGGLSAVSLSNLLSYNNMINSIQLVYLLLASVAAISATAYRQPAGCVINFNSDPAGAKPNPFTSADCKSVSFLGDASQGGSGTLYLSNYGKQGASGNALAVNGDDASAINMTFAQPATSLELWFGNDDPNFCANGDLATLQVFSRGVQVGRSSVVVNKDDIANQKVMVSTLNHPKTFDSARIQYTKPDGTPLRLIEVIDNVTITFDRFLKNCPCRRHWRNHAQYQKCIDKEARDLVDKGLLTPQQRYYLVKDSDKSKCGRKWW